MQHGRVRRLGAVLAAEHPEGELGVVDHRSDDELRRSEAVPVGPRSLDAGIGRQRAGDGERAGIGKGFIGERAGGGEGGAEELVGAFLRRLWRHRGVKGGVRVLERENAKGVIRR